MSNRKRLAIIHHYLTSRSPDASEFRRHINQEIQDELFDTYKELMAQEFNLPLELEPGD